MKVKPSVQSGEVVVELGQRDDQLLAAASSPPFQIKKILVPIDFSDCSKKALQYALALAQEHSATLTLLYVVTTPPYGVGEFGNVDYAFLEGEMRESGEKRLATFIAGEVGDKAPAEPAIRTGSAPNEIVDLARTISADLIVISTHGHTGLKHVLLGSVAEHVVRHAPCPVLVVREREHEFVKC